MSYARWGSESDVYVFSDGVYIFCQSCRLAGKTIVETEFAPMIAHLEEHRAQGHKVPIHALDRLAREVQISPIVAVMKGYPRA